MESANTSPSVDPATTTLIRDYQGGSQDALEVLFGRYLPRVRQIAVLRVPREVSRLASRDDIVQEALIRAFRNLKEFDTETEGTFRDYLARCVESVARWDPPRARVVRPAPD